MKKIRLLLGIIIIALLFAGCGKTYWNGKEKIEIPRELRFDSFYSENFGTNTTATARSMDDTTLKEQIIDFYNPYRKNIDRDTEHPNWTPNGSPDEASPRYCYRIKILDIECYTTAKRLGVGWRYPQTIFHVMVLKNESTGEEINKDAYIQGDTGSPQFIQYRFSRLAVGEEYLIADAYEPYLTEWRSLHDTYVYRPPYIFEIHEIDGTEYLYSCRYDDFTSLDIKIEITDPVEKQVYKDYKDWDIIEYLEENGLENPTFDYKLELNEFVEYRDEYNAEWNEAALADGEPELMKDSVYHEIAGMYEEDMIYLNKRVP